MVKLILDDYEALALHALLFEKTNLPTKFRHSPTQPIKGRGNAGDASARLN